MTHFGSGTVAVVGHRLDDDRYAARRITFIGKLDHVVGIVGADAARNGTIDGIAGHVGGQRLVHGQAQTRVVRRDAAALPCSDGQLTDQLGKDLAFLGILPLFAVLDVGPFRMTSHNSLRIALSAGGAASGASAG